MKFNVGVNNMRVMKDVIGGKETPQFEWLAII